MLIALTYKKLVDRDFKILSVIEAEMPRYEYVPVDVIERRSRLPSTQVNAALQKLNQLKLVRRRLGDYVGYRLTYLGLDMLALRSLVERGVLHALGDTIGVGKESDVYSGLTPSGERVIVKFHRVGRTSFQRVVLVRPYLKDRPAYSWLYLAKLAGEREFKALQELHSVGARVPRPLGRSRHVVVTEYVEGVELYEYKDPIDPESMLVKVLETIRKAYLEVGIVHGDLSEYNIMVTIRGDEEEPLIIDWPQYVEKDHPSAPDLLRRDVSYVLRYFRKAYGVSIDLDRALAYVKGETETI